MISEFNQSVFNNPKWQIRPRGNRYPAKRWGHTGVIRKNKLYIYGGSTGKQKEPVYEIDCESFQCETLQLSNFPESRESHSCSLIKDNIMIWGGCRQQKALNDFIKISFKQKFVIWDQVPQIPVINARESHSTIVLKDKYILLYGGANQNDIYDDFWVFNTELEIWFQIKVVTGKMSKRFGCTLTAIKDKVYLFGGENQKQNYESQLYCLTFSELEFLSRQRVPSVECQLVTSLTGIYPQARSSHSAVSYLDRYLIIIGGQGQKIDYKGGKNQPVTALFNDVWIFDTQQSYWRLLQISNQNQFKPRSCFSANLLKNKIYIFGGLISTQNFKSSDELVILNLNQPTEKSLDLCNLCKLHYKPIQKQKQKQFQQIHSTTSLQFGLSNVYKLSRRIKNPFDAFTLIIQSYERMRYTSISIDIFQGKLLIIQGRGRQISQQIFFQIANKYQFVEQISIQNPMIMETLQERYQKQNINIFGFNIKNASSRLGRNILFLNRRNFIVDIVLMNPENVFYAQFNLISKTVNNYKYERAFQIIKNFMNRYSLQVQKVQDKTFTIVVTQLQKISSTESQLSVNGRSIVQLSFNKKLTLQNYCVNMFLRSPNIKLFINAKPNQFIDLQSQYRDSIFQTEIQHDLQGIKLRQCQKQRAKIVIFRNGIRVGNFIKKSPPYFEGYIEVSMRYQLNLLRTHIENSKIIDKKIQEICVQYKQRHGKRKNGTSVQQLQSITRQL